MRYGIGENFQIASLLSSSSSCFSNSGEYIETADNFYIAAKLLLEPLLSGFCYDYRTLQIDSGSGQVKS